MLFAFLCINFVSVKRKQSIFFISHHTTLSTFFHSIIIFVMVYVKRATLGSGNAVFIRSLSTLLYNAFLFATLKRLQAGQKPRFFLHCIY